MTLTETKGVYTDGFKYYPRVTIEGHTHNIGAFNTITEAKSAYNTIIDSTNKAIAFNIQFIANHKRK